MIDPITSGTIYRGLRSAPGIDEMTTGPVAAPGRTGPSADVRPGSEASPTSFAGLVGNLVQSVDAKSKAADTEVRKLMLGESDNIHRSMIAMQEAGLAFNLLVEVRNKLVESYQELMRMPV
jgi:flagellar hook-basal body complex protein FliE